MRLSEIGKVVDECWREIPEHFAGTKVMSFQIMPNHVHGIVALNGNPVGDEYIHPLRENVVNPQRRYQHIIPYSLESIIRSFKAAATRIVRKRNPTQDSLWQRSFHDHIIRNDIDHFFIERYIELNPLMWELDQDNPQMCGMSIEVLRKLLKEEHGLMAPSLSGSSNRNRVLPS